jgi:hypothetical protein
MIHMDINETVQNDKNVHTSAYIVTEVSWKYMTHYKRIWKASGA